MAETRGHRKALLSILLLYFKDKLSFFYFFRIADIFGTFLFTLSLLLLHFLPSFLSVL